MFFLKNIFVSVTSFSDVFLSETLGARLGPNFRFLVPFVSISLEYASDELTIDYKRLEQLEKNL